MAFPIYQKCLLYYFVLLLPPKFRQDFNFGELCEAFLLRQIMLYYFLK